MVGPLSLLALALSGCIWVTDDEVAARDAALTDADADGFTGSEWGGDDCDDADPDVYPGAAETPYDDVDNDCDTATPDDDLDGDAFDVAVDCDDTDASVYPGAAEICDDIDQDCDDVADNGVLLTVWTDGDGDGFGDPALSAQVCIPAKDQVDNGDDCVDDDPAVHPDAPELCDGFDNDCDALIDDDDTPTDPLTWYADTDRDDYGDPTSAVTACLQPPDHVDNGGDCNDSRGDIYPGALETLGDLLDGDCDGTQDGFGLDLIDTRGSKYVRSAKLSFVATVGSDEIHLGWSSVEYDDGSKEAPYSDAMMVATYGADDPLAGEIDFYAHGTPGDQSLGVQGEAADFLAAEEYFVWARNFDGSAGRILQLDAYDRVRDTHGHVGWQQDPAYKLFEDLQVGFSGSANVTAIGCSSKGGGMEAARLPAAWLVDGDVDSAEHDFQPTELADSCEYDDGWTYALFVGTGDPDDPVEFWNLAGDDLAYTSEWTSFGYTLADQEATWQHGYWTWVASLDVLSGSPTVSTYAFWLEDPDTSNTTSELLSISPPELLYELDAAPDPDGRVVGCGVGESGDLYLFMSEPLGGLTSQFWPLDIAGGVADDCGVAVTGEGVVAVTAREGDDIWLGFVALP